MDKAQAAAGGIVIGIIILFLYWGLSAFVRFIVYKVSKAHQDSEAYVDQKIRQDRRR